MLRKILAPGVEDGGDPEVTAQLAGIAAEALERGGGGLKEEAVDQPGVTLSERVEGVREREDHVEVLDGEELAPAGGEPALGGQALALGAVAVAAGVVGDELGAAGDADGPVAAEGGGAAGGDGAQGAALSAGQGVGLLIRRAMGADDIGQLDPAPALGTRARSARRRGAHASAQAVGGSSRSSGEPVASTRAWLRWK